MLAHSQLQQHAGGRGAAGRGQAFGSGCRRGVRCAATNGAGPKKTTFHMLIEENGTIMVPGEAAAAGPACFVGSCRRAAASAPPPCTAGSLHTRPPPVCTQACTMRCLPRWPLGQATLRRSSAATRWVAPRSVCVRVVGIGKAIPWPGMGRLPHTAWSLGRLRALARTPIRGAAHIPPSKAASCAFVRLRVWGRTGRHCWPCHARRGECRRYGGVG